MSRLTDLQLQIRNIQREISNGHYEQNGLTKAVNRLNKLKGKAQTLIAENENRNRNKAMARRQAVGRY